MKHYIQHLLRENLQEIAWKSLLNCHVKGLHSIMLCDKPGQRVRLFLTAKEHELHRNSITTLGSLAAHAHHCNITIEVVQGSMTNMCFKSSYHGHFFPYTYTSAILTEKGGFKMCEGGTPVEIVSTAILRSGQVLVLDASDIHSVYVPYQQESAWLVYEGKEDFFYDSVSYSNHNLEQASFEGLYQRPTPQQVRDLLSSISF